MGQLVISDVDDGLIDQLHRYADLHRYPLEEMLREILAKAISSKIMETSRGIDASTLGEKRVFPANFKGATHESSDVLVSLPQADWEPNGTILARLARGYADAEMTEKFGDPVEWQRAQRQDRPLPGREV